MRDNGFLIDDLLKLAETAFSHFKSCDKTEGLAQRLNLVGRSEFDAAFAMLAKARLMQEDLRERLEIVENRLGIFRPDEKNPSPKTKSDSPKARKTPQKPRK